MRLKLLMVTILVVFSAGIISSVIVIKNKPIPEVDLIAINDVVKTVEKNWGQINEETLHNSNIKQSFSIIDNLENVIYQTPGNHFIDLYEAIKSKEIMIDLKQNNEIVGKLIISNNEQDIIQQMKNGTGFNHNFNILFIHDC